MKVCESYNILISSYEPTVQQVADCSIVLQKCSDLPDELVGWTEHRNGKLKWRQKVATPREIIIMAHHCIKWGVFGSEKYAIKPSKTDRQENKGFDPSDFVMLLVDEFGIPLNDAWGATMTEFQQLCHG